LRQQSEFSDTLQKRQPHIRKYRKLRFEKSVLSLPWKLTPIITMVSLVDLLGNIYAPIQTMILPYFSIADVINLTLTCKGFDQLQSTFMATVYSIDRLLGRFFDDPLEFRSLQGKYEAIVTGHVIHG
jgi:hypothetical protein